MMEVETQSHKIRWMILADYQESLEIEQLSFEDPWTDEMFKHVLRGRNAIAMIAEDDGTIDGFLVYELSAHSIEILNLAVHPDARRKRVGSQLVDHLKKKLTVQKRNRLKTWVRETNVPAQLFLREQGFTVIDQQPGFYGTDETAYKFVHRLDQ